MKKLVPAIAALCACAVMFTACGGSENAGEAQDETVSVSAESTGTEADGNSGGDNNTGNNDDSDSAGSMGEPGNNSENSSSGEGETAGNETASGENASENISDSEADEGDSNADIPGEEIVFDSSDDDSEEENTAVTNPVFASVNEFAEADISLLPLESIAYANSHTYNFLKKFDGAESLHLEVADHAAESFLTLYLDSKNSRLSMTSVREDIGMILPIIVSDSKMYILDPVNMTGVYMNTDKSIFNDILYLSGIDKEAVSGSKNINRCNVTVGGKDYVFENSDGGGFLYKTDGTPYAIVSNADSLGFSFKEITEFSENIPDGVFDIPSDYELIEDTGTGY